MLQNWKLKFWILYKRVILIALSTFFPSFFLSYLFISIIMEFTFHFIVICWNCNISQLYLLILSHLFLSSFLFCRPLIQMHSWFSYRGHTCMVFPKHGLSLYDFMSKNDFRPFSVRIVKEMGFQLLHSVACIFFSSIIFDYIL